MSLTLQLRPVAEEELAEAAQWYEQRVPGLGTEFIEEVQRVFDTITTQPYRYAETHRDIREAPIKRFPFSVMYRIRSNRIVVIAVFHQSRDPDLWQNRH